MTITQKTPSPTTTSTPNRSGFQSIPTRIRDVRDLAPLLVQPIDNLQKDAVVQSLGELGQKLAEIHRTAAEAYMSQNMYEQALPHVESAAIFGGTEIEYHNQLGFVRYVTGDDVGAIKAFDTVLATDGKNAEAWFNKGMVLFGTDQYAEAEDCFRRSLESDASDSQTWNNRGVCLFKLNRSTDAKVCFQKALQIDPNDQDAIFNLASF